MVRALAEAQKRYRMANGEVASSFSDLDISIPNDCTVGPIDWYMERADCRKFALYLKAGHEQVMGSMKISDGAYLHIYYPTKEGLKATCSGNKGTRAAEICKSYGGNLIYEGEMVDYEMPL